GVLLLLGGLGSIGRRRAALLPWAFAVFLLVAPVAALDFDHRYVLPAIPFACVAAALAVAGVSRERSWWFRVLTFRMLTSLRKNT
ncbi:MAG: hypothetical protein HOV97_03600, partial [Nonomuraea sp.]|nr:hypothetical protein [Nonomuraea sp.]